MQYRYATKLSEKKVEGAWSGWQDTPITATGDVEVESCMFYQYRDRPTVYHFYRVTGWSDWLEATPLDVNASEVETAVRNERENMKMKEMMRLRGVLKGCLRKW